MAMKLVGSMYSSYFLRSYSNYSNSWSQQPESGLLASKGTTLDTKRSTILFLVNADGSEKLRIVVVHDASWPPSFRANGIREHSALPCWYYHTTTAWMRAIIWYDVLRKVEAIMRIQQRRILLLSDNVSSHPRPESPPRNYKGPTPPVLQYIQLEYFAPNMTAFIQPLDAGIIRSFKARYRQRLLEHMVNLFGKNPISFSADKTIDIYSAIMMATEAWDSVPSSLIFNCWQKTGIIAAFDKEEVGDVNYDAYIKHLKEESRTSIASLLDAGELGELELGEGLLSREDSVDLITDEFIDFDEDITDGSNEVVEEVVAGVKAEEVEDGVPGSSKRHWQTSARPRISGSDGLKALDTACQYLRELDVDRLNGKSVIEHVEYLEKLKAGIQREVLELKGKGKEREKRPEDEEVQRRVLRSQSKRSRALRLEGSSSVKSAATM